MDQTKSELLRGTHLRMLRNGIEWALTLSALCLASSTCGAEQPYPQWMSFDELFAPSEVASTKKSAKRDPALNVFKSLALDDGVTVSGFVASRKPKAPAMHAAADSDYEAMDYRTYLGVNYKLDLAQDVRVSGRTFYGAGTYDGDNSQIFEEAGALPDEVRSSGAAVGEWFATDWQLSSKLFDRHTFQAAINYRQELQTNFLQESAIFRQRQADAELDRLVNVVARSEVALAPDLSLKTRVRLETDRTATAGAIDPHMELRYKPQENASVIAVFDQAEGAPVSHERAYHPAVSIAEGSNRIRNYELAYEHSLTSLHSLRVAAFRYNVEGLLAQPAPAAEPAAATDPTAQVGSTGFEIGMERRQENGTRTSITYARQQTADLVARSSQGGLGRHLTKLRLGLPIWANRLSTDFELQYHQIVSPLIDGQQRDYVIGNLTLASRVITRDSKFSIGMHNVFDVRENAIGIPLIPAEGRSLRLDVTRKF